jgi:hypothetical protein
MNTRLFAVSSCIVLLTYASCSMIRHRKSQALMPGTWQSTAIAIDGDSKDWPSPYPNYDATAMVAYATSNDKENLYITMETGDEMTQLKILKQGMTVSIDTTAGKQQAIKINYPLENDNDPLEMSELLHGAKTTHMSRPMQQKIAKLTREANQFSIEGSGGCNGGFVVTQATSCGIKVRMAMDEYKELVWEAVIPFKTIYNKETITAADAGKPMSVCFAVKGFKHPQSKGEENNNTSMNTNMAGGGTMNSGMPGSGNARRGGGGTRNISNDPMQHLYETTKTWKHFGLAWQQ